MTAPLRERLTVQQLIDRSSHCIVGDGQGTVHSAVKAKISDLRILETTLTEALAALAEREKDAERLEFVVGCSRAMGLKMDGLHNWSTMYPSNVRGPNLREAIDAAIKEEK